MFVHVVYGSESGDSIVKCVSTATTADVLHMDLGVLCICTMNTMCVWDTSIWSRIADRMVKRKPL